MKRNMRRSQVVFKAIVIGNDLTNEDIRRIANHSRFRTKLFYVGDTFRTEIKRLSPTASEFTVINYYYIDDLSISQYFMHLFCKIRTAALRKMRTSEFVVKIIS